MHAQLLSVWLFATPWTVAHQVPPSVGYPRQEYWSELPFHTSGDFLNPEIESTSLTYPALAGGFLPLCHLGSPSIKSDRKANNVRLEKGVRTSMKRKKVNYIYCSKSHDHKLISQKCHFPFLYQKRCNPCCLWTFTDIWKHSIQSWKGLYISTFEEGMW